MCFVKSPGFYSLLRSCQSRTSALASLFFSVEFRLVSWPLHWPVCWYTSRGLPLLQCQPEKRLLLRLYIWQCVPKCLGLNLRKRVTQSRKWCLDFYIG